jgi:hypothetical protein
MGQGAGFQEEQQSHRSDAYILTRSGIKQKGLPTVRFLGRENARVRSAEARDIEELQAQEVKA